MAQFDLTFAIAGNVDPSWLPTLPLRVPDSAGNSRSLEEVYASASEGKIEVHADYSNISAPFLPSLPAVGAVDLQAVLHRIANNQSAVWPVPRLGLIYASFYRARAGVYGLMFDKGISDPFDPTTVPEFHRLSREGCAVFLGAVAHTGLDRPDFENQIAFTTVHELGHVFNLQHLESAPCFLNTSTLEAPSLSAFTFLRDPHIDCLSRVEFDPNVAPGGAAFGETGVFPNADAPVGRTKGSSNILRIEAGISPAEFWPWEPVELDVRLVANSSRRKKVLRIPDQVDAGYSSFEIWIEEPTGERRRYRPPRRYCALPSDISLKPGEIWQRDISIFCEAGGYTFRKSGLHRLWVRFQAMGDIWIQSKPCEILIKEWRPRDARARRRLHESECLLRNTRHTLYYRSGNPRRVEVAALNRLISGFRDDHVGGSALYALGRLCASRAMRTRRKESLARAQELLQRAAQHGGISGHRRRNAEKALAEVRASRSALSRSKHPHSH